MAGRRKYRVTGATGIHVCHRRLWPGRLNQTSDVPGHAVRGEVVPMDTTSGLPEGADTVPQDGSPVKELKRDGHQRHPTHRQ